ncbi:hypothetical protein N9Z83_02425 [Akkermansiaceae bacterium]|nr:hypothetical protein [Akkermansiaceae bacterium]
MDIQPLAARLNRHLGPYQPIALLFAIAVPLLSLSRLALAIWQSDRIASTEISWATFFLQGIRADLIQVSILAAPLVLFAIALATPLTWKLFRWLSYGWLLLSIILLVFLEAATPSFILQYDLRPTGSL